MRYAIVADVHGNLAAFTAVLDDIRRRGGVKELWCLGDVVGYGPDPHQCLELLRRYKHVCVAGNHDWAAIGRVDTSDLNSDAALACRWTAQQLSPEDKEYLKNLPKTLEIGDFTLVHGSPREPIWEYVLSTSIAAANFPFLKTQFCLVGHYHVPSIFRREEVSCYYGRFSPDVRLILGRSRLIINPGSVGQPRDGDPRASYAIYDSEVGDMRLHRVPYDIEATQTKMMNEGLPVRLVTRLSRGL